MQLRRLSIYPLLQSLSVRLFMAFELQAKNDSEDSGTEEPLELEDDSAEAAGPLPSQHCKVLSFSA